MKEKIPIIVWAVILIEMAISFAYVVVTVNKKIDKLIDLNTPEYINVIPDVVITEKR